MESGSRASYIGEREGMKEGRGRETVGGRGEGERSGGGGGVHSVGEKGRGYHMHEAQGKKPFGTLWKHLHLW